MSVPTAPPRRATLDDLSRYEGKVELINGTIEQTMGTGYRPAVTAQNINAGRRPYSKATKKGVAMADGVAYAVP